MIKSFENLESTYQIIIIVLCALVIFFVVRYIYKAIRRFKRKLIRKMNFASSTMKMIKDASENEMKTPRNLSGSDSMFMMRIGKDFPEYNNKVAKGIVTSVLFKYFGILNGDAITSVISDNCTSAFISELNSISEFNSKKYNKVKIHKSIISDYKKNNQEATILYQLAVEYITGQNNLLSQHVYEVDYTYYLAYGDSGENESLVCSHCGAAISNLGHKVCEYCDTEIQSSIERTWKVSAIRKR